MILTTHALVGAALGKYVSNPWIITLIAIPLHYFLDTFRHGEYLGQKSKMKEVVGKVAFDIFSGLLIVLFYIFFSHPTVPLVKTILFGAFISMFPDFITFLHWKMGVPYLAKIYQFHQWVHKFQRGSKERAWTLRNTTNDIIFSAIAILLLFL
ncbi:MAG: hypothetical protein ACD_8C00056G0017 [uncultured bacterium]|nr:MAG: hypothetical protein ACD_8C00056G0017 [uncultured bacterium]